MDIKNKLKNFKMMGDPCVMIEVRKLYETILKSYDVEFGYRVSRNYEMPKIDFFEDAL